MTCGDDDIVFLVDRVEVLEFFYAGRSYCKLLDMSFMVRVFHFWKGGDNVRELHKCFQHDIVEHEVHSLAAFSC